MIQKQFTKTNGLADNEILEGDGFIISYLSGKVTPISIFASDNNEPETALVKGDKYYILNGDFRKEYADMIEDGFSRCFAFFEKNIDKKSSWSD